MKDYIKDGIETEEKKRKASEDMNSTAEKYSGPTQMSKQQLLDIKDYVHYYGNGWGKTAIDRSKEKCAFPDRVSPTFRKLVEIISNLRDADMLPFLQPYLDACTAHGVNINITVAPSKAQIANHNNKALLERAVASLDKYQTEICELNDYITGPLAEQAEHDKYVSKEKFKDIILKAYDMKHKDDTTSTSEKVEKQIEKNDMYNSALDDILNNK